jgi:hypothetical protein
MFRTTNLIFSTYAKNIPRAKFFTNYQLSNKITNTELNKNGFDEPIKHVPIVPFIYIRLNEKNNPNNKIYEKVISHDFPFNYSIADDIIIVLRSKSNSQMDMDYDIIKFEKHGFEIEIYKTCRLMYLFGYWKNHEFVIKFLGTNRKHIEELMAHTNNNHINELIKNCTDDILKKNTIEISTLRQTINKHTIELNVLRQKIIINDRWDDSKKALLIFIVIIFMTTIILKSLKSKKDNK